MSFPVYSVLLISSHQQRMNPQDRIDLEKLRELENIFREDPANWGVAVALARTLHNLRRDKPALEIMQRIPLNVLNPPDRLFLAAFSGFLWFSRKRKGEIREESNL